MYQYTFSHWLEKFSLPPWQSLHAQKHYSAPSSKAKYIAAQFLHQSLQPISISKCSLSSITASITAFIVIPFVQHIHDIPR